VNKLLISISTGQQKKLNTDGRIMSKLRQLGLLVKNGPKLRVPLSELPNDIKGAIELLNNESFTEKERATAKRQSGSAVQLPTIVSGCGVYLLRSSQVYKIGCTGNVRNRMVDLWEMLPPGVRLIAFFPTSSFRAIEWLLHKQYADRRIQGEWFNLSEEEICEIVATTGFLLVDKSLDDFLSEI
jgi:hypothetical protein